MRLLALLLTTLLAGANVTPALAAGQEAQIGQQVYAQLQQKGEIITSSPLYGTLNPIAMRIKRVADSQYQYPFHFILVHEKQPNAFAVPGGNVYVTDSLMHFVQNTEELAGVLCHETSHDIHHDVVNNMRKDQNLAIGATVLSLLLGAHSGIANSGINLLANLQAQSYSREVETAADQKGSDTCAAAGYNPWGMIWLFENFEKSQTGGQMEMLSDHPTDSHRIADLKVHFRDNPARFGRFSSHIATGTPLRDSSGDTRALADRPYSVLATRGAR
ncbi:MAG: M48 family metallopeptidase [Vulcanimicrobiaceae bacterium]